MEKVNEMEVLMGEIRVEAEAFYGKGNKSAGTRLRQKCQALKTMANEVRANVSDIKNADA